MKILHFADLHLGVESYGRIDPQTGLSTRLLDVLRSLDQLVDYATGNAVDLVLFCGDAYKNREPSQTHQREFARRLNRLSAAGIPVVLLTGNHDLPNAMGRATSTEIFSTLAVQNVQVSTRPEILRIETASGPVQVATMPWLRRGAILAREDTRGLNFQQINERIQQSLTGIIAAHAEKVDRNLPAVLAAHVWVTGAVLGTEKSMTIGQEHTLLLSTVANPAFDYVALGHIHRAQVLRAAGPTVAYSGSLDRLDFGDEGQEKGFYVVEISGGGAGRRDVKCEFHPVNCRRFLTIPVTLDGDDPSPTETVVRAIEEKREDAQDAIVRLNLAMPAGLERQVSETAIRKALDPAHFLTISRDVKREARVRLAERSVEGMKETDALKLWLDSRNTPKDRAETLMEYGRRLIEGEEEEQQENGRHG